MGVGWGEMNGERDFDLMNIMNITQHVQSSVVLIFNFRKLYLLLCVYTCTVLYLFYVQDNGNMQHVGPSC